MERLYRLVFFGLFILGFVGIVAASSSTEKEGTEASMLSLIKDVRLAQEINDMNSSRWNRTKEDVNDETLSHVEALFANK